MKIILILGNKLLSSGKMSNILKERLDLGMKYYNKNDIFLVSGGNPANVSHTEAYVMKKYILRRLPNAEVISESKSLSTKENIQYSKNILKDYKYEVLLVTSPNHLKRVRKLVKGLDWKLVNR
jgi:vancomycin permeability regulator SanA